MSIGKNRCVSLKGSEAFTALELLLGVVLTVLLALGSAPLVFSIQQSGSREADRTVRVEQARVAIARFEKDLRTATAVGCPFAVSTPMLHATSREVVFLGQRDGVEGLTIFEWELVGSSLMRRWGRCPSERPTSFAHSLYVDSKTMLEGLAADASLAYFGEGVKVEAPVADADLCRVSEVTLSGEGRDESGSWSRYVESYARVGR